IDALPEEKKLELLYAASKEAKDEALFQKLAKVIEELKLFDFDNVLDLLHNKDFTIQKYGIQIATFDKPFYNAQDVKDLKSISEFIRKSFTERGKRTTKKGILSSKEKDVWICECGKTNDIGKYCSGCEQDIYGFKKREIKPSLAVEYIEQKAELILEYL